MRILAIGRAECFSPNSVEKDRAIMEAVVSRLRAKGHSPLLTSLLGEELIPLMGEEPTPPQAPLFEAREFFPGKSSSPKGEVRWGLVLSMGRLPETLRQLRQMELAGVRVINSPQGVERCARSRLKVIMQEQGIPMAPAEGPDGYWLKRGDAAAQSHSDVVFAADREQLEREIAAFRRRGIDDYTVEAHVVGDVVKFYGVRGTGFFRYYYPTDDGDQKFGDEARNGAARHYPFSEGNLQLAAERLAVAVGVDIYGGDCIVRADGSFCVIDFNDWPSFSRCRDEAAEAIVSMIEKMRKKEIENRLELKKSFKELLQQSFKSDDTEEWLDVWFTRPIGLAFALMWIKVGVTPNFVTILSMFLGAAAGWCFVHTELWWNVGGVVLMMLANFCDSTDGQMARLTNHKTVIGRMLDGFASDVWYFFCYLAIAIRLWDTPIPGTTVCWRWWIVLLCSFAGFYWHARQCQLADYYRQIHLYFIKGEEGSELNSSEAEERVFAAIPTRKLGPLTIGAPGYFFEYIFHYFYRGWCKKQEKNTPEFQRFFAKVKAKWPNAADMPQAFREAFRRKSLPLMKYTNILTHNTRATVLFIACLINKPYLYPLFEITVLAALYYYMRYRHETMCKNMKV